MVRGGGRMANPDKNQPGFQPDADLAVAIKRQAIIGSEA